MLCTLVLVGLTGCSTQKTPLVIGYLGALSGRSSDLGTAARDGALLAVEQANAKGGVGGRVIKLVVADDAQDPETARKAFGTLVNQGALAVVGPTTSSMSVVVTPLAKSAGVALVSPSTSTDELTGKRDLFFRVYPDNTSAAVELAKVVREDLGFDSIAIIYDLGNKAHTVTWAEHFSAEFERLGGSVGTQQAFISGVVTAYPEVAAKVAAKKPPCVFLLSNALDTALFATLLRENGYSGKLVASEWSATEVVIGYGGEAVEGMTFLESVDQESKAPAFLAFKDAFRARFGYEAGFASVHGFEAAQVVLQRLAMSPGRRELAESLSRGGSFDTIQGRIRMDGNGDVSRPYYVRTVRDGAFGAGE